MVSNDIPDLYNDIFVLLYVPCSCIEYLLDMASWQPKRVSLMPVLRDATQGRDSSSTAMATLYGHRNDVQESLVKEVGPNTVPLATSHPNSGYPA